MTNTEPESLEVVTSNRPQGFTQDLPEPVESASQFYDHMSAYYHLIYKDWRSIVRTEGVVLDDLLRDYIPSFRSPASCRVLDCAAGIGTQTLGLWQRDYDVTASDVSNASLSLIGEYAAFFKGNRAAAHPIKTRNADFRGLSESFRSQSFDAVICMDNAVAHMPTRGDLERAVDSMTRVLAPQGVVLLSVRPYEELMEKRPSIHPESPRFFDERTYFQIWRWTDRDAYISYFFLILDDGRTMTWSTRFRAVTKQEILSAFSKAGFEANYLLPAESGYFQPVIVARRAQ